MLKENGTIPLPLESCWLSSVLATIGLWFLTMALEVDTYVMEHRRSVGS